MNPRALIVGLLALAILPAMAQRADARGCLAQGTPILTPNGSVPIESLSPGDVVWSVNGSALCRATVVARFRVTAETLLTIRAAGRMIQATPEHPFQTEPGVFTEAGSLRAGDVLWLWRGDHLAAVPIDSIESSPVHQFAYNLMVSPNGAYLADGLVVHNKGCFLPDTPILKSDGTQIAISKVRIGDSLKAFTSDGRLVTARVEEILTHQVDEYYELKTDRVMLKVTAEHPFFVGHGTFKTLASLRVGDSIFAFDGTGLSAQTVTSIERIAEHAMVYNLQTDEPHTFFANGVAVHNKGGCFLPDTPILKSDGTQIAISKVRLGDSLEAFAPDGRLVNARVEEIVTHEVDEYCELKTDRVMVRVTAEHPFFVGHGTFKTLASLRVADSIFAFDGTGLRPQTIVSIKRIAEHVTVYNLQTDEPHTFFANGIAVHNKGGGHGGGGHFFGGGHGYYGGSSQSPTDVDEFLDVFIPLIVFIVCFFGVLSQVSKGRSTATDRGEELDFLYSPARVRVKATATEKLLTYLAAKDRLCDPATLKNQVESSFVKLQQCWEARNYEPMRSLEMPDLFHSHDMQLAATKRQHEINHIADLNVTRVDLVHVRYMVRPEQREFTALISGTARDYYTDDRTGKFIRGDRSPASFQELWIFHLLGGRWLLREIEQTRESDALGEMNVVEGMSDDDIWRIVNGSEPVGTASAPIGRTPAPTPTARFSREPSRLDALLATLAVREPAMWDRALLTSRARDLFIQAMLAEETCMISPELSGNLLEPAATVLQTLIADHKESGQTVQHLNLCVRKVELVLVSDHAAQFRCEYVARVNAHAQKTVQRGQILVQQDPYELPFVKFLTFGWDGKWKLKEFRAAQ